MPLSELQMQPQSVQPAAGSKQTVDSAMSSVQSFQDLRPMQHFSSFSQDKPQAPEPGSSQMPRQALEFESKPAPNGNRENIKPNAHSWQVSITLASSNSLYILPSSMKDRADPEILKCKAARSHLGYHIVPHTGRLQ